MSETRFFPSSALAAFVSAKDKTVDRVVCHLFLNMVNKDQPLEVIDNVEFHFTDDSTLTIGLDDAAEGLDVIRFDMRTAESAVPAEFTDRVRFVAVDASATSMWKDVIGRKLNGVRLTRDGDNYRSDSLVMDFGEERREISLGPMDGIIIDFFED